MIICCLFGLPLHQWRIILSDHNVWRRRNETKQVIIGVAMSSNENAGVIMVDAIVTPPSMTKEVRNDL